MRFNPDIIRSDRKSIAIDVRPDGKVTVRAPFSASYKDIEKFVESNAGKIEKVLEKYRNRGSEDLPKYTEEELEAAKKRTAEMVPAKAEHYAALIGVKYNKIGVRTPKTRWGSCSSKGNLNFSALLAFLPEEIADSVIVHELCHLKEMNHSKRFYDEILKVMPDYHEREKWLKANGYKYTSRL